MASPKSTSIADLMGDAAKVEPKRIDPSEITLPLPRLVVTYTAPAAGQRKFTRFDWYDGQVDEASSVWARAYLSEDEAKLLTGEVLTFTEAQPKDTTDDRSRRSTGYTREGPMHVTRWYTQVGDRKVFGVLKVHDSLKHLLSNIEGFEAVVSPE